MSYRFLVAVGALVIVGMLAIQATEPQPPTIEPPTAVPPDSVPPDPVPPDPVLPDPVLPVDASERSSRPPYVLPNVPLDFPPLEPLPASAKRAIDAALGGELGAIEGGDMVVQGFVEVIQASGGSVLKGSSLDPALDPVLLDETPIARESAQAAEQLLKASRLLEEIGELDSSRAALIHRMRVEARKLLSE